MNKYKTHNQSGEREYICSINALTTSHYAIPVLQSCSPPTPNPAPNSCREILDTLNLPNFLILKAQCARIRGMYSIFIVKESKDILEEKSRESSALVGESDLPARLCQNRFEGDQTTLPLDSYYQAEIPIKVCGNQGLIVMGLKQGGEGKSPKYNSDKDLQEGSIEKA